MISDELWAFVCDSCASKISMTKTNERPKVYCLNCPTLEMRAS